MFHVSNISNILGYTLQLGFHPYSFTQWPLLTSLQGIWPCYISPSLASFFPEASSQLCDPLTPTFYTPPKPGLGSQKQTMQVVLLACPFGPLKNMFGQGKYFLRWPYLSWCSEGSMFSGLLFKYLVLRLGFQFYTWSPPGMISAIRAPLQLSWCQENSFSPTGIVSLIITISLSALTQSSTLTMFTLSVSWTNYTSFASFCSPLCLEISLELELSTNHSTTHTPRCFEFPPSVTFEFISQRQDIRSKELASLPESNPEALFGLSVESSCPFWSPGSLRSHNANIILFVTLSRMASYSLLTTSHVLLNL